MEDNKEGGLLEEPETIRWILGGEVTNVARNPLRTVPNYPVASVPINKYPPNIGYATGSWRSG